MVAHADSQPDRDIVEPNRDSQRLPAKHKEGGHGPNMQKYKEIGCESIQALAVSDISNAFSFHVSPQIRWYSPNLSGGNAGLCKTYVIPKNVIAYPDIYRE